MPDSSDFESISELMAHLAESDEGATMSAGLYKRWFRPSTCRNCGAWTDSRISNDRLRLLPYPRLRPEWWCPRCQYGGPVTRVIRRWIPLSWASKVEQYDGPEWVRFGQ